MDLDVQKENHNNRSIVRNFHGETITLVNPTLVKLGLLKLSLYTTHLTLPKRQFFDSAKLKEVADDNFELNENGGKFF